MNFIALPNIIRENVFFFVDANVPFTFVHLFFSSNSFVGSITGFFRFFSLLYYFSILGLACICSIILCQYVSFNTQIHRCHRLNYYDLHHHLVVRFKREIVFRFVICFDHYITAHFGCNSPWFMFDAHMQLNFIWNWSSLILIIIIFQVFTTNVELILRSAIRQSYTLLDCSIKAHFHWHLPFGISSNSLLSSESRRWFGHTSTMFTRRFPPIRRFIKLHWNPGTGENYTHILLFMNGSGIFRSEISEWNGKSELEV